ncbi:hypothetical protein [Rippkaea orientalis]|nr:hypothetical protein [Rippkaea orientalis]
MGPYLGINNNTLRFFTPEEKLVLTPEETTERLAKKLQYMGIDPSHV